MENKDFDDFLADANKQAIQDAEMEVYFQSLGDKFERALIQHEVPHIASSNPDIQAALMDQAISEYTDALRDRAVRSGEPIDPIALEQSARTLASQQMIHEHATFLRIMIVIAAYDSELKNGNTPDKSMTDQHKKQLIADIIIENELNANDAMINFMNDVIPGESLDTTSRDDDAYMLQAIEKYANRVEQEKKTAELTAQTVAILEKADELSADRLKTFTHLVTTAIVHMRNGEQASAMRQAKYDEIIRDDNLPANIASQLIQLIDQYYPLPKDD